MEKEIKAWLKGERDYSQGVHLYQKYGKNSRLKSLFLTKENDYTLEKLPYELGKLVGIEVEAAPIVEAPTDTDGSLLVFPENKATEPGTDGLDNVVADKLPKPHLTNQDYPEDLAQMVLERAALTNKKGMLSNSLDKFAPQDNEGRKAVMEEIATIRERINVINETERYWQKNRQMPKPADSPVKTDKFTGPLPTDPVELLKEKKAVSEARSKAKSKLAKVGETSETGQQLAIKIQKLNERYESIEKALA